MYTAAAGVVANGCSRYELGTLRCSSECAVGYRPLVSKSAMSRRPKELTCRAGMPTAGEEVEGDEEGRR